MSISNLVDGTKDLDIKINSVNCNYIVNSVGNPMISFNDLSSNVIDFNNKTLLNVNIGTISESATHLIVNDSLQIGAGADQPTLYNTGTPSNNLVVNVPSGKQLNLSVNNTAQAYVDGTGMTIPSGSLFISSQGANITQSNGDAWYRVNSSKAHRFKVNGIDEAVIDSSGLSLPSGNDIKINNNTVLSSDTLGAVVTTSSLESVGILNNLHVKNAWSGTNVVYPDGTTARDTMLKVSSNNNGGSGTFLMFDSNQGTPANHNIYFGKYSASDDTTSLNIKHVKNNVDAPTSCISVDDANVNIYGKLIANQSTNSDYVGNGSINTQGGLYVGKDACISQKLKVGGSTVNYIVDCSGGSTASHQVATGKTQSFKCGTTDVLTLSESQVNLYEPTVINNNSLSVLGGDIILPTTGSYLQLSGITGNDGYILNNNSVSLQYEANGTLQHKFRCASNDKLTISSTELRSNNTTTSLGYAAGAQLTITQDSSNCYYNVPSGKSHKFQANGVDIITLSSNGILASNGDFYGSSHIKLEMGLGQGYGLITSTSGNNPSLTLSSGVASNTYPSIQLKPNYNGTVLNGFIFRSQYGDNASVNNRYNSSMYIDQYINQVDSGPTVNAYENRMNFGSQRQIRLSTTGNGTNDIYFSGGDAWKTNGTASWNIISDIRTKDNIIEISPERCLQAINKIKVKEFEYNEKHCKKYGLKSSRMIGIVAQDLLESDDEYLHRCVINTGDEIYYTEEDEDVDADGIPSKKIDEIIHDKLGVNTGNIDMLLYGCIQKLTTDLKEVMKQNKYLLTKLKEKDTQITEIGNRLNLLERNVQNTSNIDTFDDSVSYTKGISDNVSFIG